MFVFFPHEMLSLLVSLHKLSNYDLNFLIIQLRLLDLTTPVSLPSKPLLTIACQLEYMLSILLIILTLKTV